MSEVVVKYRLNEAGRLAAFLAGKPAQENQEYVVSVEEIPEILRQYVRVDKDGKATLYYSSQPQDKAVTLEDLAAAMRAAEEKRVQDHARWEAERLEQQARVEAEAKAEREKFARGLEAALAMLTAEQADPGHPISRKADQLRDLLGEENATNTHFWLGNAKWAIPSFLKDIKDDAKTTADRKKREAWIEKHGSPRLKAAVAAGFNYGGIYRDERLALERPGWHFEKATKGLNVLTSDVILNPSECALEWYGTVHAKWPSATALWMRVVDGPIDDDDDYNEAEAESRGVQWAGLILVDTKYEFGRDAQGNILLIDEVHTPDSSRYFYADTYESLLAQDQPQRQLSKEFVREWLMAQGFQGKEGQVLPDLPDAFRVEIASRYIELYEKVTGLAFEADTHPAPVERIEAAIAQALQAHPC